MWYKSCYEDCCTNLKNGEYFKLKPKRVNHCKIFFFMKEVGRGMRPVHHSKEDRSRSCWEEAAVSPSDAPEAVVQWLGADEGQADDVDRWV